MARQKWSIRHKREVKELYELIKKRKQYYWIVDFKAQEHQQPLIDNISKVINENWELLPKYRFLLFQWWNGAGKTNIALYIVVLFLMGELTKEYGIPYIWTKRRIYVWTKSGSNLKNTIETYLLGDYSNIRIPPEVIKSVNRDNWTIKTIVLKNWNSVNFFTYDQWYERIQWTNWDLYLLDEEPKDSKIFTEAIARIRWKRAQMFLSMTPLSWYTPVYEFFYEQDEDSMDWKEIIEKSYVQIVSSLDNKMIDHTWTKWLTEDEKKMRVQWAFSPATWLVFPNFDRNKHTVEYFDPHELEDVKFYAWLDFWVEHPTAFTPIAVDWDWKLYIFDLIYESNLLIKDLAKRIKGIEKKYDIEFEEIIADSAGKRERIELEQYWVKTVGADKRSKWENDLSNRRAWIMKVNQLLYDNKLFIADNLKPAIKEFENHSYKEWWKKDWDVNKVNDDFLDSLRYFIFSYKAPKYESKKKKEFEKKHWTRYSWNAIKKKTRKRRY